VVELVVPTIADVCLIHVAQADGSLDRVAAAIAPGAKASPGSPGRFIPEPATERSGTPSASTENALSKALESGEMLLVPQSAPGMLEPLIGSFERATLAGPNGAQSLIIVPLVSRSGVAGTLTLGMIHSGRRYTEADSGVARDLATRIALSIENARLYQDARRAIEARQELLSFVSHDLRSPLMGILLTTESMLKAAPSPDRRASAKQIERVRRAVLQMRHMIDDLLDVSTMESGRLSVNFGDYDATGLLEEALEMLGPLLGEKRLVFEVQPPAEPCRVRCDRERILQVFANLVGNAIKFTPEGGRITVRAERSGGGVRIAIRDTGPGLPPSLLPHLFQRYWQADRAGRKGTGLGLYIAKGIVESQGGTIWAESSEPDGTTFCFTLPLVPPPEMDRLVETMKPRRGPIGKDPIVHSG
jgi:signal transduction histidine kinase